MGALFCAFFGPYGGLEQSYFGKQLITGYYRVWILERRRRRLASLFHPLKTDSNGRLDTLDGLGDV